MFRGSTFMEANTPAEEDQPLDLMNTDVELDDPDGYMNINTINIEDDMNLGDDDNEPMEEPAAPGFENSPYTPLSDPSDVDDRPIVKATQIDIMGSDDSDVHNEYERKDVDTLNTLIASEQSAIGEYFTAAKDTNNELLRRLYSDIGDEERFHSEQLIFAKSQLTGEKYIPRDPNVKKEYEELMAMGMDEETAMATAVDKVGLMPKEGFALIDPVAEVEECVHLQHDVDDIESALYQEALLDMIMMSPAVTSLAERDNAIGVLMESYLNMTRDAEVYLEAVENISDMPQKQVKTIENPIKVIIRWIGKLLSLIKSLGHKVAVWATKMRNRRKEKFAWIKRHGIGSLFKSGIGLYFWNDNPANGQVGFNWIPVIQYNHMLLRMMMLISQQWGLTFETTPQLMFDFNVNDIKFNTLEEGVERINNINMYKTKVLVNEANQPVILEQIFGYNEYKINYTETDPVTNQSQQKADSANVYNIFSALTFDLNKYLDIANALAKKLDEMVSTSNAAKSEPEKFKKSVDAAQKIIKAYNMLISALASDMNACMKLNNDILNATKTMDEYDLENGAGAYGGDLTQLAAEIERGKEQVKTARENVNKAKSDSERKSAQEGLQLANENLNKAVQAYNSAKSNPKQHIENKKNPQPQGAKQ